MSEADNAKSILTSKTFWGAAVMLAATYAPILFTHLGFSADASTQSMAVDKILSAVGFAITVYGRWVANKPVSLMGN